MFLILLDILRGLHVLSNLPFPSFWRSRSCCSGRLLRSRLLSGRLARLAFRFLDGLADLFLSRHLVYADRDIVERSVLSLDEGRTASMFIIDPVIYPFLKPCFDKFIIQELLFEICLLHTDTDRIAEIIDNSRTPSDPDGNGQRRIRRSRS